MPNPQKKYFLPPTFDLPRDGGPLALGNIIISPSQPVTPLLAASALTTPISTTTTTKHNLTWSRIKSSGYRLGLYAAFLSFLGADAGVEGGSQEGEAYRFERVETEEFWPDEAFLREALGRDAVRERLESGWGRSVYVVVGIKTVVGGLGAEVRRVQRRRVATGLEARADVGLVAAVAPGVGEVGPRGEAGWESGEGVGFDGSDGFVFAFRVLKVSVRRGKVTQKEFVKGAMFGVEEERVKIGGGGVLAGGGGEGLGGEWDGMMVAEGEEGEEIEVFVPRTDKEAAAM